MAKQALPHAHIPGLIDAHTHLTSCKDSAEDLVQRAHDAGVELICTVGDGLAEAKAALQLAQNFDQVFAACAIHPTRAHELDAQAKADLEQLCADPQCVAVGETGLDTYWIKHEPERTADLNTQLDALAWHAELAVRVDKPLMIHNREADQELLEALADYEHPVILHCFSSDTATAEEAIARGWVLSFAGNVTFKRNEELREIAGMVPVEQLLVETDAPYMTPEPHRGARNEPAIIGHTFACVAQQRGVAPEELAEEVNANFHRIYKLL